MMPAARTAAIALGLAGFAATCAWLLATFPAGGLDERVAALALGLRTPDADRLAVLVTMFGDAPFLTWPMLAIVGALAAIGRRRLAADATVLFLAAPLLTAGLKLAIRRPRPPAPYLLTDSFAFPSGHTLGGAVLLGALAVLVLVDRPDASRALRALVYGVAAIGAVAIAASRVWLAAHWLGDVLASLCLALALVAWFAGRAGASPLGGERWLGPWLVAGYLGFWAVHAYARLGATIGLYSGAAG